MIDSEKDKPAIVAMTDEEVLESCFTLIRLLHLEWHKLETFYWPIATAIDRDYRFKHYIDGLMLNIYNMYRTKEENTKGKKPFTAR